MLDEQPRDRAERAALQRDDSDRHADERQGDGEAPFPPSFALQPGEPKRVQPSRDTRNKVTGA